MICVAASPFFYIISLSSGQAVESGAQSQVRRRPTTRTLQSSYLFYSIRSLHFPFCSAFPLPRYVCDFVFHESEKSFVDS
jgi:hypothetical protein